MAEANEPVEPQGGDGGKEPETDWKAEARKWERRSKENAEKAKAYDELQEQSKTELEKAREQAASYKKQVDELNARAERDAARAKVAKDTGVPAELISGVRRGCRQVGQAVERPAHAQAGELLERCGGRQGRRQAGARPQDVRLRRVVKTRGRSGEWPQ